MIWDTGRGVFLVLHIARCATCETDTPHVQTSHGDRCLACDTEREPDAPA